MGPLSSPRAASPSPTRPSASPEPNVSLTDDHNNLPSSPDISYAPHARNSKNSLVENDGNNGEDEKAAATAAAAASIPSSGPILPIYADTNGSDITAVVPSPKQSKRTCTFAFTIHQGGESGRSGFHPLKFLRILLMGSSRVSKFFNVLWPVVPVAIALQHVHIEQKLITFIFSYLAVLPCANLIGFSGTELARKLPHIWGILAHTLCESLTEIILIMVLLRGQKFLVIQAAILGSILATMLLCLGLCFFIGGLHRREQVFSETVTEAGSGLLLAGGVALAVPTLFYHSLLGNNVVDLRGKTRDMSRIIAVLLLVSYFVYVFFQASTHRSTLDRIFEDDTQRIQKDYTRTHRVHNRPKFTFTECVIGLVVSITLVTFLSIGLVSQIQYIVDIHHVSDPFIGLILIPLCEKSAEHFNAVEEAWEDRTNYALWHILNATLQTALFTAPLAVVVGWCLNYEMDFNFDIFNVAMLILGIIAVGGFMRDQKSNYLEGFLCLVIYASIAIAAWYYPNPDGPGAH